MVYIGTYTAVIIYCTKILCICIHYSSCDDLVIIRPTDRRVNAIIGNDECLSYHQSVLEYNDIGSKRRKPAYL